MEDNYGSVIPSNGTMKTNYTLNKLKYYDRMKVIDVLRLQVEFKQQTFSF